MKNTKLIAWMAMTVIAHVSWMASVAHAEEDASAQYNLGVDYYNDKDYPQAAYWFNKAAEQGLAIAQFYLGQMYESGRGVTQDDEQAVEWWKKAAEQGNASAQYHLGWGDIPYFTHDCRICKGLSLFATLDRLRA